MAAQVKKYDPNQYNFGDFAKTMNQNFAIERSQNGQGGAFGVNAGVNADNPVNLGGATNSQTLGNLGQNSANGVGAVGVNAGGVGNLSGVNTLGQAKPLAGRDVFRGITNSFFDTLKANGKGESVQYSSPLVPKTPESSPTVQKVEADIPEPTKPVYSIEDVMKNGYGYFNKNENGRFELTDSNVDAVREYLMGQGYSASDIDKYLQNTNTLVYDYNNPAIVGDNAGGAAAGSEAQLSQGGQVVQSEEGPMDFSTWQSTYSIDPAVEYQNAQAQLDYEFKTWMSDYGARAEQLYQMGLSNSGVSDIYGANAYTAYVQASMDLKRAQIQQQAENKRAYQEYLDGIEAQQSAVTSAAFNSYAASYTPAQEQSIRVALAAQGLSAEQVESAIAQLNNYYNSLPEDQRPDVVASNAKVNEAFQSLAASYATDTAADKDQRIRNMYAAMGWSQSEIDKLVNMLNGVAGVIGGGTTAESIINDAAVRIATAIFTDAETGESTYTGSESQKNYIRQLMQLAEYKDFAPYVEEIIAKMDEDLAARKGAAVSDIVSNYEKTATDGTWLSNSFTSSMTNYISGIEQYKKQYGINSTEYKDALAAGSASIKDYILAATDDETMLEQSAAWLGDGVNFAEMDVADRINAMLDGAGELHRDGYMTDEDYGEIIREWLTSQIAIAKTEKKNAPVTELAGKLKQLQNYRESGYMNQSLYAELMIPIIDQVKTSSLSDADSFYATIGVNDTNAKISFLFNDTSSIVNSEIATEIKDFYNKEPSGLVYYDGQIYYLTRDEVYSVTSSNSYFLDGKKYPNKETKEMYWDLLKEYVFVSTYEKVRAGK